MPSLPSCAALRRFCVCVCLQTSIYHCQINCEITFCNANEAAVGMIGGLHLTLVVLLLLVTSINKGLLSSSTLNTDRSLAQFGPISV